MANKSDGRERATVFNQAIGKAAPVGISLLLAASMTTCPVRALAETAHVYEGASITVTQPNPSANAGATFDAYKLFDADISGSGEATHVQWASDEAKTTVLAFFGTLTGPQSYTSWLSSRGLTQEGAGENAQNAADFTAYMIAHDSDDEDFGSVPATKAGGSFADRMARAVQASSVAKTTSDANGVITGVTEGFFLIVTTPSTIGPDEAGSAPMWVPVGGTLSSIQSKEAKSSTIFQVKEDKTSAFGLAADSNTGQDLEYRVVGSVPDNIGAYASFHDCYVVTLPATMVTAGTPDGAQDASTSSFTVSIDGQDVTSSASIASLGNVVTVDLTDLRAIEGVEVGKGSVVTVGYRAHLQPGAMLGAAGQETVLVRTCTNDPVALSEAGSTPLSVKNFAYQAEIVAIDKANHAPIEGVKFTVRVVTDQGELGDYLQADGSLGEQPHEFQTGVDGRFLMPGIDEGVYTVHETGVPDGYQAPDSDTVLTVTSEFDPSAGTVAFTVVVTGGEAVDVEGDEPTKLVGQDAATGLAQVQIANERAFEMPITGLRGNAGVYVTAAVLGVAGIAAFSAGARSGRKGSRK